MGAQVNFQVIIKSGPGDVARGEGKQVVDKRVAVHAVIGQGHQFVSQVKLCHVAGLAAFCSPRCSACFLHQFPHQGAGIAAHRGTVAEQADVKIKPGELLH